MHLSMLSLGEMGGGGCGLRAEGKVQGFDLELKKIVKCPWVGQENIVKFLAPHAAEDSTGLFAL